MVEYATVDQLREEGVSADMSDAQLTSRIQRASALIENWTGRWFYPKHAALLLDGSNNDILQIGPPIIAIGRIRILSPDLVITSTVETVDLTSVRVYNRHLSQNLLDPDDRNNPKVQYVSSWLGTRRLPEAYPTAYFPPGTQNIEVTGVFGYTDPDDGNTLDTDGTPLGKTPDLISAVCMMLVVRDLKGLADLTGRNNQALQTRVTQFKTRDQSISYNQSAISAAGSNTLSLSSGIYGNDEIRAILLPYMKPPALGSV